MDAGAFELPWKRGHFNCSWKKLQLHPVVLRCAAVRACGAVRGSSWLVPERAAGVEGPCFGWALQQDGAGDGARCNVRICLC